MSGAVIENKSSIEEKMENKDFIIRLSNIGLDIIRTFKYLDVKKKRSDSFKKCALDQLDYIIEHDENDSYVRECYNIKKIFLDLLDNTEREYDVTREDLIRCLNTVVLMGKR